MNKKVKELNDLNNRLDAQINEENQEIFTDMICYLRGANISDYDQELVRRDLTEMVLSAQSRGENIHTVIGGDFKLFCDNVIANLPPKTAKEKLTDFFDIVCYCLSILGGIAIITAKETIAFIAALLTGNPLNFNISVSTGAVISMVAILAVSVFIVEAIMKNSFQITKIKNRGVKCFFIAGGIMAVFLLIAWLGKRVLFTLNIFVALAIVFCLYLAHKFLAQI